MTSSLLLLTLLGVSCLSLGLAADAEAWRSRSIYQALTDRFARTDDSTQDCPDLHTYCGGTFKGLMNKLDFIASMGFDAIWISPVIENIDGGYHGYWAKNLSAINSHFGTEQDLKDLVAAAHSKGMWVMVGVVGNHVGPIGVDFSQITPFNDESHYHPRCQIENWNDQHEVENCRLADLPDLAQENPFVKSTLLNWVGDLVKTYSFDGIRIDTIPEVPGPFWKDFADAAGVYQVGECFNSGYDYVGNYQNYVDGMLNYPLYFALKNQFGARQSMYNFRNHYQAMSKSFKNQDLLGNFVDNHDNARFLNSFNDQRTFKSALAFALASRGIPMTYYGSEYLFNGGNDPFNREALWTTGYKDSDTKDFLTTINNARKQTQWYNQEQIERYVDDTFYAFSRGSTFFAFTNQPDVKQVKHIIYHPYKDGQVVCNIFYPANDCITVTAGAFDVDLLNGEVKIFVPKNSFKKNFLEIDI